MAFTGATFQTLNPNNDDMPQVHTYRSADAVATIAGSGYFNTKVLVLKVNDLIIIAGNGVFAFRQVATNNGTTVTTAVVTLS